MFNDVKVPKQWRSKGAKKPLILECSHTYLGIDNRFTPFSTVA